MSQEPLELLHSAAMPAPQGHWAQATYRVLPSAAMFAVFAALAAAGAVLPLVAGAPAWGIGLAWLWSLLLALLALLCWGRLRAGLKPSNWLLRADDAGLYVKFRSYLNHGFSAAQPDVVFVPRRAVTRLQPVRLTVERRTPGEQTSHAERRHHLEVELTADGLLAPLAAQLKVERQLWSKGWRGRSRHGHVPVSIAGGRTLRLHWRAGEIVRPSLPRAVAMLARWYPVAEPETAVEIPADRLARAEREARILDLVEQGEHFEAIKLARELYGLGLKEAKDFVDELRGR